MIDNCFGKLPTNSMWFPFYCGIFIFDLVQAWRCWLKIAATEANWWSWLSFPRWRRSKPTLIIINSIFIEKKILNWKILTWLKKRSISCSKLLISPKKKFWLQLESNPSPRACRSAALTTRPPGKEIFKTYFNRFLEIFSDPTTSMRTSSATVAPSASISFFCLLFF